MNSDFCQKVEQMKKIGEFLIPYTFPLVHLNEENVITPLKQSHLVLDGYDLICFYSKGRYPAYYLETLHFYSEFFPSLPFYLVCKFGRLFLGERFLHFKVINKKGKMIYHWICRRDLSNNILPPKIEQVHEKFFEGFSYYCQK